MPDLANIHIDVALTNVSIGYTNASYIADMVFPRIPVALRSDKYFLYNKNTFLSTSGQDGQGKPQSFARPGGRSTEIQFDVSTNPYYCELMSKSYSLRDAEVRLADTPLVPAVDATEALTMTLMNDNEWAVAAKAMKRANYAASNRTQLVTTTTSWAASTGKPISNDIPNAQKAIVQGMVRAATHITMNYNVSVTLAENADYLDKVKYVSREGLTSAGVAPVIKGLQTVESMAQKITSTEGITPYTNGYIWTDDQGQDAALVYYKPPSAAGLKTIALGLTFEAPDDTLGTVGYVVKRWREEWADKEMIEVRTTRDWRIVSNDGSTNGDNAQGYALGGYLISGCTL